MDVIFFSGKLLEASSVPGKTNRGLALKIDIASKPVREVGNASQIYDDILRNEKTCASLFLLLRGGEAAARGLSQHSCQGLSRCQEHLQHLSTACNFAC